jgi:hypothetical protein
MTSKLISVEKNTVKIEVEIELGRSMLESEDKIQAALNEAGSMVTGEALKCFDTDGSPLVYGGVKLTSKGQEPKTYQTPYGEIKVFRHLYQTSQGGKTFCPLERDARVLMTSTPGFAKMVSHKFANGSSCDVERDLHENHGRKVARSYLQNLSDMVGSIAQSKEKNWHYAVPRIDAPVSTISIGMDGTCMLLCDDGYRETMAGTISLYDHKGDRQYTIYLGATPEYGKATFIERMEREIAHVKTLYPQATYVGLADGASENWTFLEKHTQIQILDFYHATGYLASAATATFPRSKPKRQLWLDEQCHQLKHTEGAADILIENMKILTEKKLNETTREKLDSAITYFQNHKHKMDYSNYRAKNLPIGSGVTEAACKNLVKKRLCCSGMKWKEKGAGIVLSLRSLVLTWGRWEQFWGKISQYGVPEIA